MTERRVTQSGKDTDGDITHLCNPGAPWSPKAKDDAIREIEGGTVTYYVKEEAPRTDVHVVNENGKKYLRTDKDKSSKNNLDNLPNC